MRVSQHKEAERAFYDQLFARRQRFDQFQIEIYELMAREALTGATGDRALELGCGSGSQAAQLTAAGFTVLGLDLSLEGIRIARAATRQAQRPVWLLQADAEQAPVPDGSFDVCVCGLLLHHFRDFGGVADEIARVLRPHGFVVALDANAHNPFAWFHFAVLHRIRKNPRLTTNQRALSKREIERVFRPRGFEDFRFRSLRSELRRDWLEDAFKDRLYHGVRAALLGTSELLLPQISQGNMLLSTFRKVGDP